MVIRMVKKWQFCVVNSVVKKRQFWVVIRMVKMVSFKWLLG